MKKELIKLKEEVFNANVELAKKGLVIYTFGNVSQIDRKLGVIAIKPSGVEYEKLNVADMVIVNLNGEVIDSKFRPSSDTKTHLILYKYFKKIGGIAHTHSRFATAYAQAKKPIECFGTTHADYFYGDIPCTDIITDEMLSKDYEEETGELIYNTFKKEKIDSNMMKACLVACHGPFTWGINANEAVFNSILLEEISRINYLTHNLESEAQSIKKTLLDKHYFRKHGDCAYYGQ